MIAQQCPCGATADKPNRDCERCQLVFAFHQLVRLRRLQKEYFRTRTAQALRESKAAENYVDRLIERLQEVQPKLF